MLLNKFNKLWRLARAANSHIHNGNILHKAPVSRSIFWSDNSWDWGIIPLSYYIPNIKSFCERKAMTDDQERKLYKMDDQKLLIELAIAFGNTDDADLGSYHRINLLKIFEDLNLDHMKDYPCDVKKRDTIDHTCGTKLVLHYDGKKEGSDT